MEFPTGLFSSEVSYDGGVVMIEATAMGEYFATKGGDVWNSPSAQVPSAKQAHLDLGLAARNPPGTVQNTAPQRPTPRRSRRWDDRFVRVSPCSQRDQLHHKPLIQLQT
jgi:hypothetical protein